MIDLIALADEDLPYVIAAVFFFVILLAARRYTS